MTPAEQPSDAALEWPSLIAVHGRSDRPKPLIPTCTITGCLDDGGGDCTYCGQPVR